MHFAPEIDVRRLGQELELELTLLTGHGFFLGLVLLCKKCPRHLKPFTPPTGRGRRAWRVG